jgi:transcriptional regulator with XRE-family HTH domain
MSHDSDLAITEGFVATGFVEAVSGLRRQRGISVRELSQLTGLTVRTIADIEAGRRKKVHPGNAVRLADELRLTGGAREHFLQFAAGATVGEPVLLEAARSPELFGREQELAAVADLLLRCPLVILTGPGGVGKTALAEATLASLGCQHLALDLTRVPAGEDLAHAIATVSRFDEATDAAWVGQLGALLPPNAVLLLDNRLAESGGMPPGDRAGTYRQARERRVPGYGRSSRTTLTGVWVTCRNRLKPASSASCRTAAGPAWAPSATPPGWARAAGVHWNVDAA